MRRAAWMVTVAGGAVIVGTMAIHGQTGAQKEAAAAPQAAGNAAAQTNVPVKTVVLFSSGVGYFEHAGTVKDNQSTELRFKTNQINDLLKSLVMEDMDGGKISTVTYASQEPLAKILKSFQVDITSNPSMGQLLNQLRGAKVKVSMVGEKIEGTIIGLEQAPKAVGDKAVLQQWVLNLLAGGKLRSVELSGAQDIELEDAQLQAELSRALAALAQARDTEKKSVTVNFTGQGERHVRLGYVVETPIWKTSYRLVLGEKPAGGTDGKLQGWAIVENQTDSDWTDVNLSLVSGRPISFIQDLYQPLYIPRPVVQPQLYASLRPQTYEGGIEDGKDRFAVRDFDLSNSPAGGNGGGRGGYGGRGGGGSGQGVFGSASPAAERPMDPTASVASVASASKIGELFQYNVGNVTLPRQRSAMIPIITDPLEVEKVSIYNNSVLPRNPLNGARIKNTTKKHLLAGPITVFEGGGYAGDASIDNLPPGQQRLISYGIDLEVLVDPAQAKETSSILAGKIVKGMLISTYKEVFTQTYLAQSKSEKDKTLIVEHPALGEGWKITGPTMPQETTDAVYRFQIKLPAGQKAKLTINAERVARTVIKILDGDPGQLAEYAKTGVFSQKVRDELVKVIRARQAMAETSRQIEAKRQQVGSITNEQTRIRENIKSIPSTSQYYNRLLTKLNDQESELEKLGGEIKELTASMESQRKTLEQELEGMNIE